MICIKCGLMRRGRDESFKCEDCESFAKLLSAIYEVINNHIETADTIDPQTNEMLSLIADSTFITTKNPRTSIFYKLSEFIVAQAFQGNYEIPEEELNRNVSTTRGWGDALKIFEELGLITVRMEQYQRVLILTEKTRKMAMQYRMGEPLSQQVQTRLAHIYAGYVLLYILYQMAEANDISAMEELPYRQKPKTLWVILMFLWSSAYDQNEQFSEEDMRVFISRRRIPSSTRGRILRALQAMDGTTVQGLIKDIDFEDGERVFRFEDYVLREMDRVREMMRTRTR